MLVEAPPVEFLGQADRIYQTVCAKPGLTPTQIADYIEANPSSVRSQLSKLKRRGLVVNNDFGVWFEEGFEPVAKSVALVPRPAPTFIHEIPIVSHSTRVLLAYTFVTTLLGFWSYVAGYMIGIEGLKRVLGI